jgi:single-strand DNA-binding protein
VNKLTVTVWGNVATEPQHVVSPSGRPRTTFRLASTPRRKRDDGSYGDGPTSFFNVTCFGHLAINVAASVHRGDPVVLFADLTVREWQGDGGRSGRDVDLVPHHVGLDLRWGRARFERPPRRSGAADGSRASADETPAAQGTPVGADRAEGSAQAA